jgi:hypothetical protein
VTVRRGQSYDTVQQFIPSGWGGLAWEVESPKPTPEGRFMVAMEQGHLRARERLTGEPGLVPLPR